MNPETLKPWLMPVLLKILRYAVVLAGGNLAVSDSQLYEIAGALLIVIGFFWSIIEDKRAKKKALGVEKVNETEKEKVPPTIIGLFLVLALVLGLTACTTPTGASGTAPSAPAVDNKAVLASVKLAAFVGTAEALRQQPEWRPAFLTASDALLLLSQKDAIGLSDIYGILAQLPIKELKSDRAILYINAASIVLEEYDTGTIDISRVDKLRPVIKAINEGLELGLKTARQ